MKTQNISSVVHFRCYTFCTIICAAELFLVRFCPEINRHLFMSLCVWLDPGAAAWLHLRRAENICLSAGRRSGLTSCWCEWIEKKTLWQQLSRRDDRGKLRNIFFCNFFPLPSFLHLYDCVKTKGKITYIFRYIIAQEIFKRWKVRKADVYSRCTIFVTSHELYCFTSFVNILNMSFRILQKQQMVLFTRLTAWLELKLHLFIPVSVVQSERTLLVQRLGVHCWRVY